MTLLIARADNSSETPNSLHNFQNRFYTQYSMTIVFHFELRKVLISLNFKVFLIIIFHDFLICYELGFMYRALKEHAEQSSHFFIKITFKAISTISIYISLKSILLLLRHID